MEGCRFEVEGGAGVAAGARGCSTCIARIASMFFFAFSSEVSAGNSTASSKRPGMHPEEKSQTLTVGTTKNSMESRLCCMAPSP